MATRRRGMSFRVRLSASVLTVALVPLVLLGLLVATQFRVALTNQVNGSLASDAESVQQLLLDGVLERQKNVESWAEDAIVRGSLIYGSFERSDAGLKVLADRYPQFRGLLLFTLDGKAVSASDPVLREKFAAQAPSVATSPWFRAALENRFSTDDLDRPDPILGAQVIHFARAVTSPTDGKTLGVLVAAYDWIPRVNEKVSPARARAGARGYQSFEVVVARDDGTVLFDSAGPRADGRRADEVREMLGASKAGGVAVVRRKVAVVSRTDDRVRELTGGWSILAVVDEGEAYAPVERSVWLATFLVLVFGTAAVGVSLVLSRRLVEPINALNAAVDRIVRDGDLTQKIDVTSGDEIGQLAGTFARMMEKLREIPASLEESTRLLTAAVSDLSTSTSEQGDTITRQAAAIQETQLTVQEIKQTSLLAAQKADAVLKVAERAEQISRSGEAAIEQSLGGLTDIRSQVEEIADKITGLTERTRQIGLITETVKNLADQSNMLALNAAIEAVRSGEHGKGFAVVAREIRSLADQSIQATNRVREILEDISGAIRAAVVITEKGAERMEGGLLQMKSSGESLRELSGIVKDNSAAVRQIAAAVSQQNAGITQISAAVSDLNAMMAATVTRLQATTDASEVLRDVSSRVSSIVAGYRI